MAKSKRTLLCGPLSANGVSGVSLAFDLVVRGYESFDIDKAVVDMTVLGGVRRSGSFSARRALETIFVILLVWWKLLFCDIYYATMATSPLGFIRDYTAIRAANWLGRRTVLHLHGGGFEDFYTSQRPWLQRLIRANLKRTDTIVVLSELLKEQFYCAGNSVIGKLVVVPNGLTIGVQEPTGATKALPEEGPVQLLYLSNLMPSKGFFDVLRSMKTLNQEAPGGFHLNLCGSFVDAITETPVEVHDEATLDGYIEKNGLEGCVSFRGQVLGKAKLCQLEKAHVFLLPTSYAWEGQPLSIIEALAYATPIVSCRHRGIPELVKDGQTGYFVEPGSPESIALAVSWLTEDGARYSAMSRDARLHYEANFRREPHLRRLLSVILQCDESSIGPSRW